MAETLNNRGVVFWPVGTGDSTTFVVDDEVVVQVDLHDLAKADEDDTPEVAVVDKLIEALPTRDGRPYLAVFVLTHADQDHCRGFQDLLSEVTIGELWATPRLWREYDEAGSEGICEDAQAFHEEARRRVAETRTAVTNGTEPVSGDRVRIIGHDTESDLHGYEDLPKKYRSRPGESITALDGVDCTGRFEAFLHAPFKGDCAKERNDTSVAMQVTLRDGAGQGRFLLLGDLAHDTIVKIFEYSTYYNRTDRLAWDVLLAPHHCSKKVMYVDGVLQDDVIDHLTTNGAPGCRIVSSSGPIPLTDTLTANPPHRIAANRYQEITEFLCTMEHGTVEAPAPIVFEVDAAGLHLLDAEIVEASSRSVEKAFWSHPSRLGLVASAAARYGRERGPVTGTAAGVVTPGVEWVREAVRDDRGGEQAPAGVVGFGQR